MQNVRTIDHEEIKEWAEARGGEPAVVAETRGDGALLRLDFGVGDEALEPVTWEEFFRVFDDNELAFVYEEEGDGSSNFSCAFVGRDDSLDGVDSNDDVLE